MSDDPLRAAAVAVCQLWFTDNAPDGSQHVRKAMLDLRDALDALASPQPETLDVETVARAYRDAAERSSTTHDLLAQMTVNLNAALGGAS